MCRKDHLPALLEFLLIEMFANERTRHETPSRVQIERLPFPVASQLPKGIQMSHQFATLITHDGKTLIKINPLRVNYLISLDEKFTKVHFGPDQTVDVTGGLEAVEAALSGL